MRFVYSLVASALWLVCLPAAQCQTNIYTDTTINSDRTDFIRIHDGANPFHQTTVTVINPANTRWIFTDDTSILNIQGGTVEEAYTITRESTINVSGGHVLQLGFEDIGSYNISGGSVDRIDTFGRVSVTGGHVGTFNVLLTSPDLRGGSIGTLTTPNSLDLEGPSSTIDLLNFGGSVLNLNTSNVSQVEGKERSQGTSTVNILGGSLTSLQDGSFGRIDTVNVYAGQITGQVRADTINFYGGQANSLGSTSPISGLINMYGGYIAQLAPDSYRVANVFNVYGGSIGAIPNLGFNGTFNFYGSGLSYDGSTVRGILSDGSPINLSIPSDLEGVTVNLFATPEPNAASLFIGATVSVGVFMKRRKRFSAKQ